MEGNARREELESIISDMKPYKVNTFVAGQLARAETIHEELSTKLFAEAAVTTTPAAAATATGTSPMPMVPPPYKVKPPTFSGKPREFQIFKTRFTAMMDTHKRYYSDSDKLSILAEAMDDGDARNVVLGCYSTVYDAAMTELQANYGRKTIIFPQLVDELVKRDKYDYSRESMKLMMDRSQRVLMEMDKLEAKNIEMLTVALIVKDFDSELLTEWTKHLGSDDKLPTLKTFTDFVTPLSHNLPKRGRNIAAPKWQHRQQIPTVTPLVTTTPVTAVAKTESQPQKVCPVCKESQHPLYRCKRFKDATVTQRWQWVKQHKCCHNCLHSSHAVTNCTSTYSCKFCKLKRNYLLHKDEDNKKQEKPVTALSSVTQGKPSDKNDSNCSVPTLGAGFIHTALVTLQHQGRRITARAALDNCSTHSIISEDVASFLQPERKPVNMIMKGTVAESKQINTMEYHQHLYCTSFICGHTNWCSNSSNTTSCNTTRTATGSGKA